MKITSKLTMELTHHRSSPIIQAVQDDSLSRDLELTLTANGIPWTIPQDAAVLIRYHKADGTGGLYDSLPDGTPAWTAQKNVLTLCLAPQVLTAPGEVELAVTLIRGQFQISTFSVIIHVVASVAPATRRSENYILAAGFLPTPARAVAGEYLRVNSVDGVGHVTSLTTAPLDDSPAAATEPAGDDIPKVFFGAALPQTKDDVVMSFRYVSKTTDISGYCKTKAQGNSSMAYPKKNQTVKLYKDADCTEKLKVDFKGWGKQNKFCFKANWIDLTHARNIVSARLWGDVVKSRANYADIPELLRTSPNQGAVDGFPVKVYAGGIYQGRYTINIPKDAWMANMDEDLDDHCILCGENYISGCFRAEANIDESDWTDEVHKTVPASIKSRWNEVIRFVMDSTNEQFVSGIGNYFDVESLIDYYLFGLLSCGLDAFGKNQLYMTYDGLKWYATMYDMDSTWGLYFNGSYFVSDSYGRNSYQDFADGDGNLLYIRLETLFADAIMARWEELKNGALSVENIINRFERFTDIAPPHLAAEDYAATTANGAFTAIPQQGANNIQQLRDYIVKRWAYADGRIAVLDQEYFYRLTQPMTFDGTSDHLIVPYSGQLFSAPRDMTFLIAMDTSNEDQNYTGNEPTLIAVDAGSPPLVIQHGGKPYWRISANNRNQTLETDTNGMWNHSWEDTTAIVAVFKSGVFTYGKYLLNDGKVYHITANAGNSYTQSDGVVVIGCRDPWNGTGWWKGTVNDFRIYNRALSADEIIALLK